MNLWNYYDGDLKYPDLNKHSHEKEIAKATPKWAFEYILKHGKDEDLEPAIAKNDGLYSYKYALNVLKGPFKLGEPAIAKNSYYSFSYAFDILNGPFPLGEPAIAKSAYYSLVYATHVLNGPFPLGEKAIANAKNAEYSKKYTNAVLKKDFYLDGKLICNYEE